MSAPASVESSSAESSATIVLDASLTPASAQPITYRTEGGISAKNAEFNGFLGSSPLHGFVLAVHEAFSRHLTLELTPDDFWSLIVQGLGEHVAKKPEKHRSKLVKHAEGKNLIRIIRNDLVRGNTTREQWMSVVHQLTEETIKGAADKSIIHDVQQTYSTSTDIHRLLYAGAVLSTLQHFNEYRVMTLCGIPKVTLKGAVSEWQKLQTNLAALNLKRFDSDLSQWDRVLRGIIDRIVDIRTRLDQPNATTKEDVEFFRNIYKWDSMSGGDVVSGWITGLFPYLGRKGITDVELLRRHLPGNLALLDPKTAAEASVDLHLWDSKAPRTSTDSFSTGLVDIPFIWEYMGTELPMTIYVGFDDPLVDATTSRTRVGFAVSYKK